MMLESLEELVAPIGVSAFAAHIFGRKPHSFELAAGADAWGFDVERFETILWRNEHLLLRRLRVEGAEGAVDVPGRRAAKDLFRWAIDQFLEGKALTFERLETVEPSAAKLACDIAQKLLAKVTVDAVLLPAGAGLIERSAQGGSDVFLIQTFNSACIDLNGRSKLADCVPLRAGDALYVPEQSIRILPAQDARVCLVLRIVPLSALDLLECLVEVATENAKALRITPHDLLGSANEACSVGVAELLSMGRSGHFRQLALERLKLRIADEYRPAPGRHLQIADAYANVDARTLVRVRTGAMFAFNSTNDGIYLYVAGIGGVSEREADPGGMIFPLQARALLAAIRDMESDFTADDLPKSFSANARVATIRRLLWEGALQLVADDPPAKGRCS